MQPIKKALISVSDKSGVSEFARQLSELGIEILSTGGTAKALQHAGVAVTQVESHTRSKEILGGRVKTLHPAIHGGILAVRDNPEHIKQMEENGIEPIDMVVANLYPFERTVAKPDVSFDEAIENIDIGGPAMVRAAAKNHRFVTVITDPADYPAVIEELKSSGGTVSEKTRLLLAEKAFRLTAGYDSAICGFLRPHSMGEDGGEGNFPNKITLLFTKQMDLRYGENPHQKGAFYTENSVSASCVSNARQLQGKTLSLNNIYDTDSAFELAKEFDPQTDGAACVIVKHNNPCGVALAQEPSEAFLKAKQCDPVSAFGGIVALNCEVDSETARHIADMFVEVVIAPGFSKECVKILSEKQNLRVLETPPVKRDGSAAAYDVKKVTGGALIQDKDATADSDLESATSPTERKPEPKEIADMRFAWKVCKHVKSNAIVFAKDCATIGIGAGQMSRVDSVKLAAIKAQSPTEGCVMASDAFFPFRDGIDEAAKAGIKAVIHPGGSVRDQETTEAANEHGMAVLLTGVRHFKH